MLPDSLTGNRLLDALPQETQDRIASSLYAVSIGGERHVIDKAGGIFTVVRFPVDAIFAIVATMRNTDTLEVANVGCEGFVEADAALQSPFARRESHCLVSGHVICMPLPHFTTEVDRSEAFGYLVRQSVSARLYATEQFSLCNMKHKISARLARWLLMAKDRTGRDVFNLTHESLSLMLGVRRAGVSEAAGQLSKAGAIKYVRGKITILNPARLRKSACECYEVTTRVFEDALGRRDLSDREVAARHPKINAT